jgi:hypothetical protein
MKFHCCDPRRLDVLRRFGSDNAIDFVEVLDRAAPAGVPRQRTLFVRLLRDDFALTPDNIRIDGGERIKRIGVVWCAPGDDLPVEAEPGLVDGVDDPARTLVIRTDSEGDFSRYTLRLVADSGVDDPPAGFDTQLSQIAFSFKVECPSDFDCDAPHDPCPPQAVVAPNIDYLAKDYPGFRRLMLDRLDLLAPGWTERSAADIGVTLVELLAYLADNLSYRQDAIATEAYLSTARRRTSVRRHARLVDYRLHEGCNARAWVHVRLADTASDIVLAAGTRLLSRIVDLPNVVAFDNEAARKAMRTNPVVFETAYETTLRAACNTFAFHAWGDAGCCLPRGATEATLLGHPPLAVGDVLVLREVRSPTTFKQADADRTRRWAVRVTQVEPTVDPSGQLFASTPVDGPIDVTRIAWNPADALPFALCLGVDGRDEIFSDALGNIVLADHGRSLPVEVLDAVPADRDAPIDPQRGGDRCERPTPAKVPARFRPALDEVPLTHGFDLEALWNAQDKQGARSWPASQLLPLDVRAALPRMTLDTGEGSAPWMPQQDLLDSDANADHFVVEVEHDGRARLRFGDGRQDGAGHGRRPAAGTQFNAHYRVGNGTAGNVGAQALAHLVYDPLVLPDFEQILFVENPMPAAGGVDPEDVEAARRDAPEAFRTQQRAVTAADYAAVSERDAQVAHAAATFRWTGSWHTVFVSADRPGGAAVDAAFEDRLRAHLERFRMAGYDLEVDGPQQVPLEIKLHLCVKPGHQRSAVEQAVERALSARTHSDGSRGMFHPDAFTFGDPVYLSAVIAAAQAVEGVASVRVDEFRRMVNGTSTSLAEGVIRLGRLEIAQLANDPNFRERGRLTLSVGGGQ